MNGTFATTMGDRGRLVVPAELRDRAGLREGSPLVMLQTPRGVLVMTREQAKELVRTDLEGLDLVSELLAVRQREAKLDARR